MLYQDFKDYLARFVWRDGDTVFESELDNLILLGESRLNRDLRIQRMSNTAYLSVLGQSVSLPSDYLEMRVVTTDMLPSPLTYVAPHELERVRSRDPKRFQPIFTVAGNQIRLAGADSTENRELVLTYYAKLPHFKDLGGSSWLADEYLDLYTYAVLRHTASYLKDDERVILWQNEYAEALTAVMEAEVRSRYAGSPLSVRLPGAVA